MAYEDYATTEEYQQDLHADLVAQLRCAWEEWSEQHHEADADRPRAMAASKSISFNDDEIVIIGQDRSINHYRLKLERIS
jgi:hypothetical protein